MPDENLNKENEQKDVEKSIVKDVFGQDSSKVQKSALFSEQKEEPKAKFSKALRKSKEVEKSVEVVKKKRSQKIIFNKRLKGKLPVGIDLGSHSVKIAQLVYEQKQLKIANLVMEDLPEDFLADGVADLDVLRDFLADLLKRNGIKGEAFTAIANNKVTIKNMEMPKMPLADVSSALRYEMKERWKDKWNNLSFDYIVLNQSQMGVSDKLDILTITAEKDDVNEHINLLQSTGLRVLAVEPNCFALISSLNFNNQIKKEETAIVIDFGGALSSLNIIRNGELQYTRTLNVNGNSFVNAVKDYCKVSFRDAEKIIKTFSHNHDLQEHDHQASGVAGVTDVNQSVLIKNAISFQLEKIVTDIEHTFKYYSYQLTKSKITKFDKVILCGGAANFPILVPFLKERLNVDIRVDNPLEIFEFKKKSLIDENFLKEDAIRFSVAIGLALRVAEQEK